MTDSEVPIAAIQRKLLQRLRAGRIAMAERTADHTPNNHQFYAQIVNLEDCWLDKREEWGAKTAGLKA